MKNLVKYAVAYAKAGFSVLPMMNKQPLIKFADQPPLNTEQIERLWKKYPFASIALRTTNFFVVDIDEHEGGDDGFKSIREFKNKHPDLLKRTLAQKTAGGGQQLFYLKRDDTTIHQNIGWLPGVDIKAHKNNYVVVAPSERNGKSYEWLNHDPIVTSPKSLVQLINQNNNHSDGNVNFNQFSGLKTKTTLLFETISNGLGDNGGRNDQLTRLVGGLLFRNVEPEDAYNLACIANSNTNDPLPDKELNTTFSSVQKKEIRRRGG